MLNQRMKVKDIVLEHPETARVFQERQIDFCCRGDVTIDEACRARGTAADELWRALAEVVAGREGPPADDARALDTPALIARIVDTHHVTLRQSLPFLRTLAGKVARVHGDHNPKLVALARLVDDLTELLLPHLDDEERALFPALIAGRPDAALGQMLEAMLGDHLAVGALLGEMRALADEYVPPSWACNSYRTLMRELEAIEGDTLRHVHLENHVLLPRFAATTAPGSSAAIGARGAEAEQTIAEYLIDDHAALHELLTRAAADPARFDHEAFARFRSRMLRHMAIEEKILFPDARARRGGDPLPMARRLRIEHAAIAMLTLPTPSPSLVGEIGQLLLLHIGAEEGPGGAFEQHAALASREDQVRLARIAREHPEVRTPPSKDAPDLVRTAAAALAKAEGAVAPDDSGAPRA